MSAANSTAIAGTNCPFDNDQEPSKVRCAEVWVRVVGMLVLFLGFYYTQAARKELTDFVRWTLYPRSTVILFFAIFVLLDFAKPPLILLGVVDLVGVIWTALALRSPESAAS